MERLFRLICNTADEKCMVYFYMVFKELKV